jgi:hypothetical protein
MYILWRLVSFICVSLARDVLEAVMVIASEPFPATLSFPLCIEFAEFNQVLFGTSTGLACHA